MLWEGFHLWKWMLRLLQMKGVLNIKEWKFRKLLRFYDFCFFLNFLNTELIIHELKILNLNSQTTSAQYIFVE